MNAYKYLYQLFNYSSLATEKVSFNAQVSNEGYFRPDSPWLPGTTRVNLDKDSIELRAYNKTHSSADGFKQASIFVNNILASWTNDRDKPVLRRINFEVDSVCVVLDMLNKKYVTSVMSSFQ